MPDRRALLVLAILAAQAVIAHLIASGERPPAMPDLATFPTTLGDWTKYREDEIAGDVQDVLHADRISSRSYFNPNTHMMAGLFVAWFQSQRGGLSQPHSPKVCLPGSGWSAVETGEVALDVPGGPITVNRYLAANRGRYSVILYWYQTPRRVVAGELAAKLWLVSDALRDRRTDTSLIRITVGATEAHDPSAERAAVDLARQVYPALKAALPR